MSDASVVKKGQVWKNKVSGNTITILKTLGAGKWWVQSSSKLVEDFKIRENMILDNYELVDGEVEK